MTSDEKADLVHKENRQVHDLLNQLADRIVALEINVEKIRSTVDHPMLGKPARSAVARIHRLKGLRVERGTWGSLDRLW